MDWFSNMAFIQYFSSDRSFFIVLAQYFLHLTLLDICGVPKPPARRSEFSAMVTSQRLIRDGEVVSGGKFPKTTYGRALTRKRHMNKVSIPHFKTTGLLDDYRL